MTVIDSHQHVWDLANADYAWLNDDLAPINRSIDISELQPLLSKLQIDYTVLVQSADNIEDTQNMLAVARASKSVLGVVGYIPLHRPKEAERQLETLLLEPEIVGIRNLIHDRADPDWLLRPDVDVGLTLLEERNVPFDLVAVRPRHLEILPLISARHPRLRIVVDHLGKPPIGAPASEPWWSLIEEVADNPNVFAKVSGLYAFGSNPATWTSDLIRPFFERALDLFGAGRLMYGGDWPVCTLAGGYERIWSSLGELLGSLGPREQDQILWRSAADFYGLRLPAEV